MGHSAQQSPEAPAFAGVFRELVRRWPVVLLVTLAALAAGAVASATNDPSYTAHVRLLITPLPQGDETFLGTSLVRDAGDAGRTASTLASTMDSDEVDRATARRLGGDWTVGSVHGAVDVKPLANANLVEIGARASGAGSASRVATAFAAATLNERWRKIAAELDERMAALDDLSETSADEGGLARDRQILSATRRGGRDPTLSLQGGAPKISEDGLSPAVVMVLALIGGLLLGALAAVGMSRLDRRVRSEQDVLETYPLPVLARVHPDLMLRMAEVLPTLPRQEAAFARLAERIQLAIPRGGTIALASASSGDGRTPCATSIAAAIAAGERTATVLDVELEPAAGEDLVRLVRKARRRANFVLIDGPPLSAGGHAARAAVVADMCLLVVRIGHTDRQDLRRARELLEKTGAKPAGLVLVDAGVGRGAEAQPSNARNNAAPTASADVVAIDR